MVCCGIRGCGVWWCLARPVVACQGASCSSVLCCCLLSCALVLRLSVFVHVCMCFYVFVWVCPLMSFMREIKLAWGGQARHSSTSRKSLFLVEPLQTKQVGLTGKIQGSSITRNSLQAARPHWARTKPTKMRCNKKNRATGQQGTRTSFNC